MLNRTRSGWARPVFSKPPLALPCREGNVEDTSSKVKQVARVRTVLRLKVGKTAGLAELSIGAIRDLKLDVLESPLDATDSWLSAPCHAEIVGISSNLEKQSLVMNCSQTEQFPNIQLIRKPISRLENSRYHHRILS